MSYGGSYCALSGSQGLALIELPSRWGVDGLYFNGKPQITCKIINIHEYASNQLEVVQIRWHPDSPSDSHLFVLYSDNSLRLYENEGMSAKYLSDFFTCYMLIIFFNNIFKEF